VFPARAWRKGFEFCSASEQYSPVRAREEQLRILLTLIT